MFLRKVEFSPNYTRYNTEVTVNTPRQFVMYCPKYFSDRYVSSGRLYSVLPQTKAARRACGHLPANRSQIVYTASQLSVAVF